MSRQARPVARGSQIFRLFERPGPRDEGELLANPERTKGVSPAEVFNRVAPAIVFLRSERGSGTGFLIDTEGRIVTNHHVVAEPGLDDATGMRRIRVNFGRLDPEGRRMTVIKDEVAALVYKEDPVRDLALLKLTTTPAEVGALRKIDLADKGPRNTDACIAIGHPAGGQLWTVRLGHITGTGRWPGDYIDNTIRILAAPKEHQDELEQRFRTAPGRKVVLSDCITGGGDSGGPLLDTEGRVIAVTYAGPDPADTQAAQLTYHIHLDEVRSFLAAVPSRPLLYDPDPWSSALFAEEPRDEDGDGTPETLLVWGESTSSPSAILVDLDQQSRLEGNDLSAGLEAIQRSWHPTFAVTLIKGRPFRAFYDVDGDRTLDLVLTNRANPRPNQVVPRPIEVIQRRGERWFKAEPRAGGIVDPSLFTNARRRERLRAVLGGLKSE
jgi:S1-C subfamily serine protease